jgi:hypothetical protein
MISRLLFALSGLPVTQGASTPSLAESQAGKTPFLTPEIWLEAHVVANDGFGRSGKGDIPGKNPVSGKGKKGSAWEIGEDGFQAPASQLIGEQGR